ncbi:hypothetical protein [Pedobacter nutrimenti]|jgi:hypothetical protein|uniref:Carboxypeptidase-like protein n=1 Tax=Pedobacter nutrimenti TaxID=1241337 RepID=A0A318UBY0_9SPHI|nr:hypothetical protein [Pedobacter nutrimenti]PYF70796.1 hypothetical protein B0O44_108225 [Pedobacter nutrimenti]|eukprot:gene3252-3706_t
MVKKVIVVFLFVLPFKLFAQGVVTGTVYDFENKTFPLQKVVVKNLNNQKLAITKASGQFTIDANKGDVLELSLIGYHTDTLFLTDLNPKTIFLPVNAKNLKEVSIVSAKLSPYLDLKNTAKGPTTVSTDGLAGKGNFDRAGGLILGFGAGRIKKEQAKIRALEARDAYETEINNNFNEQTVSALIKLKGQELKDFIAMFRPSVALIKDERPFNYSYYIAQAHQRWLKMTPAERKLPPVPVMKQRQ